MSDAGAAVDEWGGPVGCADSAAVDAWNAAWRSAMHFRGDPMAELAAVNRDDQRFVLGPVDLDGGLVTLRVDVEVADALGPLRAVAYSDHCAGRAALWQPLPDVAGRRLVTTITVSAPPEDVCTVEVRAIDAAGNRIVAVADGGAFRIRALSSDEDGGSVSPESVRRIAILRRPGADPGPPTIEAGEAVGRSIDPSDKAPTGLSIVEDLPTDGPDSTAVLRAFADGEDAAPDAILLLL